MAIVYVLCKVWAILLAIVVTADIIDKGKQREVLIDVYQATNGDHWKNNTNWGDAAVGPCSGWYGVDCSLTGAVTGVWLVNNGLTGHVPAKLLSALPLLWHLDLSTNHLTGTLPSELGNLILLRMLHLNTNHPKGPIPWQLGNLSLLQQLWLDGNGLTGSIPGSLSSLTSL